MKKQFLFFNFVLCNGLIGSEHAINRLSGTNELLNEIAAYFHNHRSWDAEEHKAAILMPAILEKFQIIAELHNEIRPAYVEAHNACSLFLQNRMVPLVKN